VRVSFDYLISHILKIHLGSGESRPVHHTSGLEPCDPRVFRDPQLESRKKNACMNRLDSVVGKQGKYRHLLQDDPNLLRWYRNLRRRSKVTAKVYLRRLGNFCQQIEQTPAQLIQMDKDALTDLVLDLVTEME
jgi:hypothetical protein